MEKYMISQTELDYLIDFQGRMQRTEEQYRYVPSSPDKITALLEEITDFYQARRTVIFETDWEMEYGTFTYDYQRKAENPLLNTCVPIRGPAKWINKLKLTQPIILEQQEIWDYEIDYPEIKTWKEIKTLMIAPFSNHLNQGFVCVVNPERYEGKTSYLTIISYAIVADINALKLQGRIELVEKQIPPKERNEIYVCCLGGLQMHTDKGILSDEHITAEQCYRLLVYLLMNHKKNKPLRKIADLIWDDISINDPYHDIKNIVYRLKRFLSLVELDDLIIGTSGTFSINPKYKLKMDFEEFEESINCYFKVSSAEKRRVYYEKAKFLYSGDLFPRCDHLQWFMPRTQYYQSMYLRLEKAHIEEQLSNGNYLEAQKCAVEGLEIEAFDSDLITYLIVSMLKQGNKSMANSYYHKIVGQLTQEQIALIEKSR